MLFELALLFVKNNIVSTTVQELNGKSCCEASLTFVGTTYICLVNFQQIFIVTSLERNQGKTNLGKV